LGRPDDPHRGEAGLTQIGQAHADQHRQTCWPRADYPKSQWEEEQGWSNPALSVFDGLHILKNGRSERIRTSDPLLPKQVRYQTALHSDV
jgi:hypothetical protein